MARPAFGVGLTDNALRECATASKFRFRRKAIGRVPGESREIPRTASRNHKTEPESMAA